MIRFKLFSILLLFLVSCHKENSKEETILFKTGKRMTGRVVNGEKYGVWKIWYENNKIYGFGSFYNDKLDGNWLYYDKKGRLTESEFFINGLRHGRSYHYLSDGRIEYAMDFVNDTLNGSFIHYTYDGNYIKYKIEYLEDNIIIDQGKCYKINVENCTDNLNDDRIGVGFDILEANPIRDE